MADIEQVRVRRGKGPGLKAGDLSRGAVGKAHGAPAAVIMASAQPTGCQPHRRIDGNPVEQAKLSDIESSVFLVRTKDAYEMIDHLGDSERSKRRIAGEECPHLRCGRLALEKGKHGERIKNRQRDLSRRTSSARARSRARSVLGPRPRYLPSSSRTGSSLSGRITTRSPRSTTMTRRAFQRARVSAGIETCPFRETLMTCVVVIRHCIANTMRCMC